MINNYRYKGKLITIEGLDGSGKSTQIFNIKKWFIEHNLPLVITREPGGTDIGDKIRNIILSDNMHPDTELLLMCAARREHIEKVITPKLTAGYSVLSDRFSDSTFAYQCGGRGIKWSRVEELDSWVNGDLMPDLTIFLDIPHELSAFRILYQDKIADRFEREGGTFFSKVRDAYLRRARECPSRIIIVDASKDEDSVRIDIEEILCSHLLKHGNLKE